MKCKACKYEMNEMCNSIVNTHKVISIYYCVKCGTIYVGTPASGNFVNGIPNNAIINDNFIYVSYQSDATLKHLVYADKTQNAETFYTKKT